jgi:hypothetical protein
MVTGKERYLKYTAGHMIMARMEESLFRRQNQWERMRVSIDVGVKSSAAERMMKSATQQEMIAVLKFET